VQRWIDRALRHVEGTLRTLPQGGDHGVAMRASCICQDGQQQQIEMTFDIHT
jgi:hypothetical protein